MLIPVLPWRCVIQGDATRGIHPSITVLRFGREVTMVIVKFNVRGQVIIPSKLRKKYGITKGTRVSVSEGRDDGVILLRPLPDDPIKASKGMLKEETSILKALLKDRREQAGRG